MAKYAHKNFYLRLIGEGNKRNIDCYFASLVRKPKARPVSRMDYGPKGNCWPKASNALIVTRRQVSIANENQRGLTRPDGRFEASD